MTDEERRDELDHLVERRNILIHRRRLLERQRDMLGDTAPAHVTFELDTTVREIELLEAKIRVLDLDPKTFALVGDTGIWSALSIRIERLERDVRHGLASVFEELAADREERISWRAAQDVDRHAGQRRYAWGVWAAALLLLLLLAGQAWVIWRLLGEPLVASW